MTKEAARSGLAEDLQLLRARGAHRGAMALGKEEDQRKQEEQRKRHKEEMEECKLECITRACRAFPTTGTKKEVRVFLGLKYYQKFSPQ